MYDVTIKMTACYVGMCFTVFLLVLFGCNKSPVQVEIPQLELAIDGKRQVRINETLKVRVLSEDAAKRDIRYIWCLDESEPDTTVESIRYITWTFPDTGVHQLVVNAFDKDSVVAHPETLQILVTCRFPVVDIVQRDTTIHSGDTLFIKPVASDSDGNVIAIQWQVDKDALWYSTTHFERMFTWNRLQNGTHTVRVRSVDNDNLQSTVDSVHVTVITTPDVIRILEADTVVALHKNITLHTEVTGHKVAVERYVWFIDNLRLTSDTLGVLELFFGVRDTGLHMITVFAYNSDSFTTNTDTVLIKVAYTPVVTKFKTHDTTVNAWSSMTVRASVVDTTVNTNRFTFFVDSTPKVVSSPVDSFTLVFGVADSGKHCITVYSVDGDSIRSGTDTLIVTVLPGTPQIKLPADTVISSNDTIRIDAVATDVNGMVVSYAWDLNGVLDTTGDSSVTLFYSGKPSVKVICTVTDNDGLHSSDDLSITFNTPPVFNAIKLTPDTLFCTEKEPSVSATFLFSSFDCENDSLTTTCSIRAAGTDSVREYSCGKDSATIAIGGPGVYTILLRCVDSFGNSVTITDSVTVVQNHTICFAGHSIVCGMNGDGLRGGFRADVFAGLRYKLLPGHAIKAVGPITTPSDMTAFPQDDSCFAISSSTGREMHNLIRAGDKNLSADIWVLMLGANGGHSIVELANTISIMDTMLARNPDTRVYVLTSPPFPDDDYTWYSSNYNLKNYYNVGIRESVTARISQGFHVSLVDANLLLTKPDTTFDSTWFSDFVHPNSAGYERLAAEILRVMRLEENAAIKKVFYRVD